MFRSQVLVEGFNLEAVASHLSLSYGLISPFRGKSDKQAAVV